MAEQIGVRDKNGKFGNYIINCKGEAEFSEDGKPPKFIGMDNVKLILQELVDSAEYNWLQEKEGLPTVPIMLNKLFIGKPGTGKTEVAILWARIIKELHLLSNSSFVSKTASDFISNVVGGSQTKTNAILKASMGKVLFIDEAYVLAESQFGLEVLNTIVEQVQAKPGADISVIMAGYPKEMNAMCRNVNPGLGRRFDSKFPVLFHDYSNDTLSAIMSGMSKKHHIVLLESARKFAIDEIAKLRPAKDFGNAGTINTFLDKAIKAAMTRCLKNKKDWDALVNKDTAEYSMVTKAGTIYGEMKYFTNAEKAELEEEKEDLAEWHKKTSKWQAAQIEFIKGDFQKKLTDSILTAKEALEKYKTSLEDQIKGLNPKLTKAREEILLKIMVLKEARDDAIRTLEAKKEKTKRIARESIEKYPKYVNEEAITECDTRIQKILEEIDKFPSYLGTYLYGNKNWEEVHKIFQNLHVEYQKVLEYFREKGMLYPYDGKGSSTTPQLDMSDFVSYL